MYNWSMWQWHVHKTWCGPMVGQTCIQLTSWWKRKRSIQNRHVYIYMKFHCYRPQTKLRKGKVFTPVYQSFCSRGVYITACIGQTPPPLPGHWQPSWTRHPTPEQTPPPTQCMLGYTPSTRWPLLRTVRNLLECILFAIEFPNQRRCRPPMKILDQPLLIQNLNSLTSISHIILHFRGWPMSWSPLICKEFAFRSN